MNCRQNLLKYNMMREEMGRQALTAAKLESIWRDRVERQALSGQNVETFCRNEGVSAWSMYRWRKLLGTTAGPAGAVKAKKPAGFVDLGSIPSPQVRSVMKAPHSAAEAAGGIEIRIDLGCGAVLTVTRR